MKRPGSDRGDRQSGLRRVVSLGASAAVVTGLLLASCSSDKTASPSTEAPTSTRLELGGDVPSKPAVDALMAIFKAAGVDATTAQLQSTTQSISACPLGQPSVLTATPPAPVAGLDTKTAFTLERPAAPEPGIRCTFTNDLPADVANSIPATRTSSFVEYQVTYVPGPQLNDYLGFLAGQGYDQVPNAAVGGAIYTHCAEPDAASSSAAKSFIDCGAIWTNSVVVVGLRYSGPGDKSVDVPQWLVQMIAPILDSLSKATPESVVAPTPSSTP
jgi:hypothetical protein